MLTKFISSLFPDAPPDSDTQEGLRRVAEIVDKTLAVMPGFATRLADPVSYARAYCARLVDQLPSAVMVGRPHFATDPLVHALFATADDIGFTLAASAPIRSYLTDASCWHEDGFFALLAARRAEKKVFGVAMQGEVLTTDVPQTLLQFSNQTFLLPAENFNSARSVFLEAAFDGLLRIFASHLEAVREDCKALKIAHEMESFRTRHGFPPRYVHALDDRLRQQVQGLQPDQIIGELAEFLMHPEEALSLDPVQLWVTPSGVIQEKAERDDATQIHFMELKSRDRRRHLVLPVQIDYEEARRALAQAVQARAAREYMLLL